MLDIVMIQKYQKFYFSTLKYIGTLDYFSCFEFKHKETSYENSKIR